MAPPVKGAAATHAHTLTCRRSYRTLCRLPARKTRQPLWGGAKGTIQFSLFINFTLILGASKRRFVIKFGELPATHKSRRSQWKGQESASLTMSMMMIIIMNMIADAFTWGSVFLGSQTVAETERRLARNCCECVVWFFVLAAKDEVCRQQGKWKDGKREWVWGKVEVCWNKVESAIEAPSRKIQIILLRDSPQTHKSRTQ